MLQNAFAHYVEAKHGIIAAVAENGNLVILGDVHNNFFLNRPHGSLLMQQALTNEYALQFCSNRLVTIYGRINFKTEYQYTANDIYLADCGARRAILYIVAEKKYQKKTKTYFFQVWDGVSGRRKFSDNVTVSKIPWIGDSNLFLPFNRVYLLNSNIFYSEIRQSTGFQGRFDVNIKDTQNGFQHTLVLFADGRVSAFGSNEFGQCGAGKKRENRFEYEIKLDFPVKQIQASNDFSLLLDLQGNVWFFGEMFDGEWRDRVQKAISEPMLVSSALMPSIKIAVGSSHALLLDQEGSVWGFGKNTHGQLGVRDEISMNPSLIFRDPDCPIVDIAASENYSVLVNKDGEMFTFGYNDGFLGHGEQENIYVPTKVPNIPVIKTNFQQPKMKNAQKN